MNCNKIVTNWFVVKLYLELNNNDSESEKEDSTARKRSEEPAGKFDKKKKRLGMMKQAARLRGS